MEVKRIIKKQLILDLDKNGAPTGWRWAVDRIVDFDGVEQVVPGVLPATAEEVSEHVGAAVAAQAADIEADRKERDRLKASLAEARDRIAAALKA